MRTLVIGCNHRTAPVRTRERIALSAEALPRAAREFRARFPGVQFAFLSTCNRMEVYLAAPSGATPRIAEVIAFLGEFHGVEPEAFAAGLYTHEDVAAARHLFRVASSLDSMVVGESQILAQVKSALEQARATGSAGPELEGLFEHALAVARDIHARTGLSAGKVSVGSVAADLAGRIFSRLDDKRVLMVGAGEMAETTLSHLLAGRPKHLWVTNRTPATAEELAERLARTHGVAASTVPFDEWVTRLAEADIAVTSTASREPLLTPAGFAAIPRRRGYRSLLIIDIAVPRNVDPAVGAQAGVFLYNIDDLQEVTERNLAQRREAVAAGEAIVETAVIEYAGRCLRRDLSPMIIALRRRFQVVADEELARLIPKLKEASGHDRRLIEQMLHRVLAKLLHGPMSLLGEQADPGTATVYADALRRLFGLQDDELEEEDHDTANSPVHGGRDGRA